MGAAGRRAAAPGRGAPPKAAAGRLGARAMVAAIACALAGAGAPPGARGDAPAASPCQARLAQGAAPDRLEVGDTFTVTLTLAVDCPDRRLPLALALVLDRSSSMERGGALERAKEGALTLVERLEPGLDWGTVISFNEAARVDQHLTDVPALLGHAIEGLRPGGDTNISAGLAEGRRQLGRMAGRAPQPALVLLTDGKNLSGAQAVAKEGEALRRAGVYVAAIGLGRDPERDILEAAASSPADAYFLERPEQLLAVFQTIGRRWTAWTLQQARVLHRLAPSLEALGPAIPPAELLPDAGRSWRLPALGAEPLTLRLQVRAHEAGRHPVSREAFLAWEDQGGAGGRADFPLAWVEVLPPGTPEPRPTGSASPRATAASTEPGGGTGTPVPSPATPGPEPSATLQPSATAPGPSAEPTGGLPSTTPTAAAPRTPTGPPATPARRRYLPALARHGCPGGAAAERAADLVLLLDSSTTMGLSTAEGPSRLALAQEAIRRLVGSTDPRSLRLGLVGFDAEARVLAGLDSGPSAVLDAAQAIRLRRGSRIDLGLEAAALLLHAEALPGRPAFVVLISDGLPAGTTEAAVLAAARRLGEQGARLWALGLGDAPQAEALLRALAGSEGRYLAAGDGAALAALLPALGGEALCP